MTRKVDTEACSPAPGGAAETFLEVDANNNTSNDHQIGINIKSEAGSNSNDKCVSKSNSSLKYGLRPRSSQHRNHFDDGEEDIRPSRKKGGEKIRRNHRPRILSRYKRKNANARERGRMHQINVAFEALRGVLPEVSRDMAGATALTKITTLRLAAGYIQALQDILDADERGETPDDATSAYSWLLSSLIQEDEEVHQSEESTDHNEWALPYFINQGKRSLHTDIPEGDLAWSFSNPHPQEPDTPPFKRLKTESSVEFQGNINHESIYSKTRTNGLDFESIDPYPSITDSETINLLLGQSSITIPAYDIILA